VASGYSTSIATQNHVGDGLTQATGSDFSPVTQSGFAYSTLSEGGDNSSIPDESGAGRVTQDAIGVSQTDSVEDSLAGLSASVGGSSSSTSNESGVASVDQFIVYDASGSSLSTATQSGLASLSTDAGGTRTESVTESGSVSASATGVGSKVADSTELGSAFYLASALADDESISDQDTTPASVILASGDESVASSEFPSVSVSMFGLGASDSLAYELGEAFLTTTALEPAPAARRVIVEFDLVSYAVVGSRTSQPRASPRVAVANWQPDRTRAAQVSDRVKQAT
jgi:hypothetical protein